jgi:XTP/dITP diphosphohydrolase
MERLVLATRNQGKLREVKALLANYPFEVLSLADFPDLPEIHETGRTFTENAKIKAIAVYEHTGLSALGDDSGLEVDCLGGAPGVYSARFAGEAADDLMNNQKLISMLEGIEPERRTARFRCVMALAMPNSSLYLTEGICEGMIGYELAGDQGFGYDPLFIIPEKGMTLAQLDIDIKNMISHRAQAFNKVAAILVDAGQKAVEA